MDPWLITIIQAGFGAIMLGLTAAIAFILKVVWEGLREAQKADIDQYREISRLQLMMSENYTKKETLKEELAPIRTKLDQIFDVLWKSSPIDRRHNGSEESQ
jgi:hypothetical protein